MDEDGIVEEVGDDFEQVQSSNFLFSLYDTAITTVQSYGWFIVLFAILIYYLKTKFDQRPQSRSDKGEKISEEQALERMERIEQARKRQQEAFEAAKLKYLEEKRLKEENASQARAEEWELHKQGLGYKNKSKQSDEDELAKLGLSANNQLKKKPRLRDSDFNPLMGSDSAPSCSFRSSRPGPRSGG